MLFYDQLTAVSGRIAGHDAPVYFKSQQKKHQLVWKLGKNRSNFVNRDRIKQGQWQITSAL